MSEKNGGEKPDYVAMALAYQEQRKCGWQAACLAIKHRHPEAREAFIQLHANNVKLRSALASSA